ncbi:MAG: HAD-IA family hydrolase [Planctomycetes bacterium]|nr:HAD-IA family hydrolase [Planctomycetota bacterium]
MPRFIYFDCMDTLIQMKIPSMEVYADWAYEGAEELDLWEGIDSFHAEWRAHRDRLLATDGGLREGTILGRLHDLLAAALARRGEAWPEPKIQEEAERIHGHYWKAYRSATYVLPEVPETLSWLALEKRLPLGVVSNFMVRGGIPALLAEHRLERFFEVITVSCEVGWRKPAAVIYQEALRRAGCSPADILFIGDDLQKDYQAPRQMGMRALLYDPEGKYPEVEGRIRSFRELRGRV